MAAKDARKWGMCGHTFREEIDIRSLSVRSHISPKYRVPSGTSRAKSEVVFPDLFRRKLRDGRSRKDRAERGRHHMPKVSLHLHEKVMWVNSLAALLGALAAIWSIDD